MKTLVVAALALLSSAPSRAAFLERGAGARAPGLGDAFTALADDAYAIHYNPAGLAQLERPQFSAAYSRLYVGLSDGSDLGASSLMYAQPLARGEGGTLGFGWERFSLSGLYTEQTVTASYGRRFWSGDSGARFLAGVNVKYLTHSFAAPAEAGNALASGAATGAADPALSGPRSLGVLDADLGLIYRFPRRFQLGLSVLHMTEPNAAFAGADLIRREIDLGLAYKSAWLNLIGELKIPPAADGGVNRDLIFAAERSFPTLDYGSFGLRGSLGFGLDNSDWKQMTVGASYRIDAVSFDYAFLIPIGGVQTQSGSHRASLAFFFGAAGDKADRVAPAAARPQGPDYGSQSGAQLPADLGDPRLTEVQMLVSQRRYRSAQKDLQDFAVQAPLDPGLIRLSNRLALVAGSYAELPEPKSRFDRALADALGLFLRGSDREAMLMASFASSLKPEDAWLANLLGEMEEAVRIKATRPPADDPRGFIAQLLDAAASAKASGEMDRVERLLGDVLTLEPENPTALERLGSLRYLSGRLPEAISAWEAALRIETSGVEIESLREYLSAARARASSAKRLPGDAPETPSAQAAKPAPARIVEPGGDPRDIEPLHQRGVELYARGEYDLAGETFRRVLLIDPKNAPARKALERIASRRPKK